MYRLVLLFISVLLVCSLGCEEPLTAVMAGAPPAPTDTTTVSLGGTVDIADGIRYFSNVQVYGTLTYHTVFFDDLARSRTRDAAGRVGVFLYATMWFKRIDDYQGVSQNWHAGGKSYDVLDLQEDGTALTHKRYQLWGVTNTAFVNIVFLVQRSDVRIHNIWISYEYPD